MTITIERFSEDRLTRKLWRFFVDCSRGNTVFKLAYFSKGTRQSKRHTTYKLSEVYDRYDKRNCTVDMKITDAPTDVIGDAVGNLINGITFE